MNNNYFRPLLVLVIVILAVFVGFRLGRNAGPRLLLQNNSNKISTIMEYVSRYYVDTVDLGKLEDEIIPEFLKKLDPHSVYFTAEELKQANEPLQGNFDGIGVSFNMPNDTVIIANVIPNGPSEKANVYPGDRIIKVNDSIIAGRKIKQDSVMKLLRGRSGTKVKIDVKRGDHKDLIPITITRGKIPLKSLDAAYMISDGVGFVCMTKFARNTYKEFLDSVSALHKNGMTKLILDLRGNSGGFLDQAFDIANEFLEKNSLIVYTEGRAYKRSEMRSKGNGTCLNDSIIVLIDQGSASASEILAGAIQDNDRGLIVGVRSFGKGLVQEPIDFPDGSGMRLTIARYYTPSGRCIQRKYDNGTTDYYMDIIRRYEHGEMENVDSIQLADTTKYFTTKGRVVYGGGGITPDIFVPFDTTGFNPYFKRINSNIYYDFVLKYSDKHRSALNAIKSLEELDTFFRKNDPFPDFINFVESKNINGTGKEKEQVKHIIQIRLKALISRGTTLDDNGFYYFYNQLDSTVQKALQELKK